MRQIALLLRMATLCVLLVLVSGASAGRGLTNSSMESKGVAKAVATEIDEAQDQEVPRLLGAPALALFYLSYSGCRRVDPTASRAGRHFRHLG